jgi:hypothetical protein
MNKKYVFFLIVWLHAIVLIGCQPKPSIVGKWRFSKTGVEFNVITFDFKSNAEYSYDVDMGNTSDHGHLKIFEHGTYQLLGTRLVLSPAVTKILIKRMKAGKETTSSMDTTKLTKLIYPNVILSANSLTLGYMEDKKGLPMPAFYRV